MPALHDRQIRDPRRRDHLPLLAEGDSIIAGAEEVGGRVVVVGAVGEGGGEGAVWLLNFYCMASGLGWLGGDDG